MDFSQLHNHEQQNSNDPWSFSLLFSDIVQMARDCQDRIFDLLAGRQALPIPVFTKSYEHQAKINKGLENESAWTSHWEVDSAPKSSIELYTFLMLNLRVWIPLYVPHTLQNASLLARVCCTQLNFDGEDAKFSVLLSLEILELVMRQDPTLSIRDLGFTLSQLVSFFERAFDFLTAADEFDAEHDEMQVDSSFVVQKNLSFCLDWLTSRVSLDFFAGSIDASLVLNVLLHDSFVFASGEFQRSFLALVCDVLEVCPDVSLDNAKIMERLLNVAEAGLLELANVLPRCIKLVWQRETDSCAVADSSSQAKRTRRNSPLQDLITKVLDAPNSKNDLTVADSMKAAFVASALFNLEEFQLDRHLDLWTRSLGKFPENILWLQVLLKISHNVLLRLSVSLESALARFSSSPVALKLLVAVGSRNLFARFASFIEINGHSNDLYEILPLLASSLDKTEFKNLVQILCRDNLRLTLPMSANFGRLFCVFSGTFDCESCSCSVCDDSTRLVVAPRSSDMALESLLAILVPLTKNGNSDQVRVVAIGCIRRFLCHFTEFDVLKRFDDGSTFWRLMFNGLASMSQRVRDATQALVREILLRSPDTFVSTEATGDLIFQDVKAVLTTIKGVEGESFVLMSFFNALPETVPSNNEGNFSQLWKVLVLELSIVIFNGSIEDPVLLAFGFHKLKQVMDSIQFSYELQRLIIFRLLEAKVDSVEPFEKLAALRGKEDVKQLFASHVNHILPKLVAAKKRQQIDLLSRVTQLTRYDLVLHAAPSILTYAYFHYEEGKRDDILLFMMGLFKEKENDAGYTLDSLLGMWMQNIVVQMCVMLGTPSVSKAGNSVMSAFEAIWTKARHVITQQHSNWSTLNRFVRYYFLPALHFLSNEVIFNKKVSMRERRHGLVSLREMIKIVANDDLESVLTQVLNVLQNAQEVEGFESQVFSIWLDLPSFLAPEVFGPVLSLFCANLLEFRNDASIGPSIAGELKKVLSMTAISKWFSHVFFIPDSPEFEEHNRHLAKFLPQTAKEMLQLYVTNLSHEQPKIIECALLAICEMQTSELHRLILQENVDKSIVDLIQALFASCRRFNGVDGKTEAHIRSLCGTCLGKVGAVDPGRMPFSVAPVGKGQDQALALENVTDRGRTITFVLTIIETSLFTAFRSASDTRIQDRVAFIIQELLKYCQFTPESFAPPPKHGKRSELHTYQVNKWSQLPKFVRDTVAPFMTSNYELKFGARKRFERPFYLSRPSFIEWLQTWACDIIENMGSENARTFFSPFRAVMRGTFVDVAVMMQVLPSLILMELLHSSEERRRFVLEEMMTVLKASATEGNSEKVVLCSQLIFRVMDFLSDWVRLKVLTIDKKKSMSARNTSTGAAPYDEQQDVKFVLPVSTLLSSIPQEQLAEAAMQCKAYARSLLHFEKYVRKQMQTRSEVDVLPLFEKMEVSYSHIDEPDGMDGFADFLGKAGYRKSMAIRVIENKKTGNWADLLMCYDVGLKSSKDSPENHLGVLECFKNLGNLSVMQRYIASASQEYPGLEKELNAYDVEVAWKLNEWDLLEEKLQKPLDEGNFEVHVGRLLLSIHKNDSDAFDLNLSGSISSLLPSLAAASMESYHRCHSIMKKFHALFEIKMAWDLTQSKDSVSLEDISQLSTEWQTRLRVMQQSFKHREPILNVRRVLLNENSILNEKASENAQLKLKNLSGHLWIQSAKLSRKAGFRDMAFSAIMNAERFVPESLYIERAKLLKGAGDFHHALGELYGGSLGLSGPSSKDAINLTGDPGSHNEITAKMLKSKSLLLMGRYMEQSGSNDSHEIALKLKSAISSDKSEKALFYFGRYHHQQYEMYKARLQKLNERLDMCSREDRKVPEKERKLAERHDMSSREGRRVLETERNECCMKLSESVAGIVKYYGMSLLAGTQFMFQTLPRLLTALFDYPILSMPIPGKATGFEMCRQSTMEVMVKNCSAIAKRLPEYMLISRICHPEPLILPVLDMLILKVLVEYPQQSLWQLISVSKSSHAERSARCNGVFAILAQALSLANELLAMSNQEAPEQKSAHVTMSMSANFSVLRRLAPCDIIIPILSSLTPTMPEKDLDMSGAHRPFAGSLPTIHEFVDQVDVMNSLAKPKKLGIIGSDGKTYYFLVKPKDDLRKDARVLECYNTINKLMKRDPESRRRQLYIRTYAVLPISEECGLIEWVPHTNTLRNVIGKYYRAKNVSISAPKLKAWRDMAAANMNSLPDFFLSDFLKPHSPPVFHQWFVESFTDPSQWFSSRLNWSRTIAVMSIVGYIVGLGDRHTENILIDETNGDAVHVDFNCLFDKGLSFDFPERVPFRLTHNMIDAFGVTGTDGVFTKCAEVTMSVLRSNKDTLISILEAFVHDPLVEWSNVKKSSTKSTQSAAFNHDQALQQAKAVLANITTKLEGGLGLTCEYNAMHGPSSAGKNLSTVALKAIAAGTSDMPQYQPQGGATRYTISGQVRELISQATNPKHLGQMWIGWSGHI